jgi:hypothetical protein
LPQQIRQGAGESGQNIFSGRVVWRQHFDCKVRRKLGVSPPVDNPKPIATDERNVGCANGVGIGCDLETSVLPEHRAELSCLGEACEFVGQAARHQPMPGARRLMHHELTAHKLGPLPLLIVGIGDFPPAYAVVSWLAWAPNLLWAEWFVRRSRPTIAADLPRHSMAGA